MYPDQTECVEELDLKTNEILCNKENEFHYSVSEKVEESERNRRGGLGI